MILVSLLTLFPDIKTSTFGWVALTLSGLSGVWVVVRLYLSIARPSGEQSRLNPLRRQFSSVVGFAMLLYAGARMAVGEPDSYNLFAAATMVLVSSATIVSWELLLRMAKTPRARHVGSS